MRGLRQSTLRPIRGETVEDRRRAERQSAFWRGRCHIQDEPLDLWRECAIIDVSTLGVGIDLCHPDPVELLGMWQDGELRLDVSRRITLRLELGPSVDMTVAGEVRNAGSGPDGIVRAGIEFVGLTETERSILDLLERRAMARLPEPGPVPSVPHDGVPGQLAEGLVLGGDADHGDATTRSDGHQTLVGQLNEHGLSDGRPADAELSGQLVEIEAVAGPEVPGNRLGNCPVPIGIPVYELFAKGVSYMTNRPFLVEATRSFDLVGRPLCNILGSCHGWLAKSWQAAPGRGIGVE
jgi:PilZ domain